MVRTENKINAFNTYVVLKNRFYKSYWGKNKIVYLC